MLLLSVLMDNSTLCSFLVGNRPTTVVLTPTPTEIVPYKIPAGITDYVLANRYAGDRHPGEHLLYLSQLCSLFKPAGVSREFVMRKLFAISLIDKASDCYKLLDNSHFLDWQELISLFYTKFHPLHVESKSTFLHVDHGINALCDAYIVEFTRDPTENYYEKGTYAYRYFNNIKLPLFMVNTLKLCLFCLPMLVALCFNNLFSYKTPMHMKYVRLKYVLYMLLDALFCSSTLIPTRASLKS